jgi:hypothetical protein
MNDLPNPQPAAGQSLAAALQSAEFYHAILVDIAKDWLTRSPAGAQIRRGMAVDALHGKWPLHLDPHRLGSAEFYHAILVDIAGDWLTKAPAGAQIRRGMAVDALHGKWPVHLVHLEPHTQGRDACETESQQRCDAESRWPCDAAGAKSAGMEKLSPAPEANSAPRSSVIL